METTRARGDARPETPAAERAAPAWQVWAALWTIYLVWGSTYLAIRVAVESLPALLHSGVRFLVAGSVMWVFLRLRRGAAAMSFTRRELGAAAIVGSALLLGGNGFVALAEREIPSALAALIIASVPLWLVVMRFVAGERVRQGTLAGVVLGFAGVAVLLSPGTVVGVPVWFEALAVIASLLWALGSFASKHLPLPADPFLSTALQMLTGGAALVVASVVTGEAASFEPARTTAASIAAFAYLVVVGSFAGFTAYTWALQHAPISKVSTYAYVNPVVAVVLGWLILSEPITPGMLFGAAIIVASVAFIVRQETPPAVAPAPEPAGAAEGA